MSTYHIHHYVPKHAGGTDHPSNLIKVTIREHAAYHYERWVLVGDEYDRKAWQGLSGQIGKEEIIRELCIISSRKGSAKQKELYKTNPDFRAKKLAIAAKGRAKDKELFETDAQYRANKLANAAKGVQRHKELYETDPHFRAKRLAGGAKGREKATRAAAEKNRGSCWIHNPILKISKKIQKHEAVPQGWNKGRCRSSDV